MTADPLAPPLPLPPDPPAKFLLWWSGLFALWVALVAASIGTQFSGHTATTLALGFAGTAGFAAYAVVMAISEGFVPTWLIAAPVIAAGALLGVSFTATKSYLAVVGEDARVVLLSARQSAPGQTGNRWLCEVRLPNGTPHQLSSCSDAIVKQNASDAGHPTADVEGLSVDVVYDPGGLVQPRPGSKSALGAPLAFVFGGIGAASLLGGLVISTAGAVRCQNRTLEETAR